MNDLDHTIRTALEEFGGAVLRSDWYGKEHDWVSRFVFGHLIGSCRPNTTLYSPGQLGIEVGVAQPPGHGYAKPATRRDVVIWDKPGRTCWNSAGDPISHPIAILEWKVHRGRLRNRHVVKERTWLRRYAEWQPDAQLYAVEVQAAPKQSRMQVARFKGGAEDGAWLVLGDAVGAS